MDSDRIVRILPGPAATAALGAALGVMLQPGDVVALSGPLGTGKSALARAAIRARMDDPALDAPSPTFTLVQTYAAPDGLEIWHADLYRLDGPDAVAELGLEDSAGGALLLEWPDRMGPFLPEERLDISLSHDGDGRRAELTPRGAQWRGRLASLG